MFDSRLKYHTTPDVAWRYITLEVNMTIGKHASSCTEIDQRSVLAKTIFTTLSEHLGQQQSVASFENVTKYPRDQPTDLSYKLVMLCSLVRGERCQSLHLFFTPW